jgi:glycosyltransferase involved in cell wall biosynthesis
MTEDKIDISVVIPFYNEEGSLFELCCKIIETLEKMVKTFEIILIDDGSSDGSYPIVSSLMEADFRIKVIKFAINSGKAKALSEGFKEAKGEIVFTMDADLQDDPAEIPNFIKKIEEGYDLVSGWKKVRHDPIEKRLPSKLFNKTVSIVTGIKLHDFNCGFKAYRHAIIDEIKVYGELHRYIPALAYWQGFKIGEIPVQHHARKFGRSKYGWERYLRGFFDLFTVVLLTRFLQRPIHLFGVAGLSLLATGIAILSVLFFLQIIYGSIDGHTPLSYLGVLSILLGSQLIATGLIAALLNETADRQRRMFSKKIIIFKQIDKKIYDVSIIIPLHNESDNLIPLTREIEKSIKKIGKTFEIIFVDDGSTDNSFETLKDIQLSSNNIVKIVQLRKRFGKASALQAGVDLAEGDTIIIMDADLQNDPEDMQAFITALENEIHMAVGWRINVPFPRSFFSHFFNRFVSGVTGLKLHDINCGLIAIRSNVLKEIELHGELQRFLPLIVAKKGYKVMEIKISHRERLHGKSKYGFSRIPKAFVDLFSVVLLTDFKARPLHMFGFVGLLTVILGISINLYLTILKVSTGGMGHYTILLIGVTLIILGLQWLFTGLLGEIINNLRHFERDKRA